MSTLTLITGTARSGTSTMAGTLFHLGLDLPGPFYEANTSNPRGFFESVWAMEFHQRLFASAGTSQVDSRPVAYERVRRAVGSAEREELGAFLAEHAALPQVVIKDPRITWVEWLWREVAESLGRETQFLTMLRHPAEVIGSRSTYYQKLRTEQNDVRFATMSLARWLNSALTSERGTRGSRRAFVRYVDLLADWRPVVLELGKELGLNYNVDPASRERCAVDEWIEPALRRHAPSWAEFKLPKRLIEIADEAWAALDSLADPSNDSEDTHARLDACFDAYSEIKAESWNMVQDEVNAARELAARRAERETREEMKRKVVRLRRRAKRAEAELIRHGLSVPTVGARKTDPDKGEETRS